MESREMETMLGLVELRVTNQLVLTIQSKLVNADSQMVQCSQPGMLSMPVERKVTQPHTLVQQGHLKSAN